ncbi:hypothetical protein CA13_73160 [Planctomycetes bacterium CA13]|uniref:Uncharacterized protein n=1 Tax=Novipirellula herctigrandis TaxID=2527986 RepID=A0A5C5YLC5_9BACT|nr:hypothetical protein CA13_73160 [Planctomycetes bacterium CA13]
MLNCLFTPTFVFALILSSLDECQAQDPFLQKVFDFVAKNELRTGIPFDQAASIFGIDTKEKTDWLDVSTASVLPKGIPRALNKFVYYRIRRGQSEAKYPIYVAVDFAREEPLCYEIVIIDYPIKGATVSLNFNHAGVETGQNKGGRGTNQRGEELGSGSGFGIQMSPKDESDGR